MQKLADVLIMAAGQARRYGRLKQLLPYGKKNVLAHCVDLFKGISAVNNIIVVYPPEMSESDFRSQSNVSGCIFVPGGTKRMDSVLNALDHVKTDYVLIHDAARPACTVSLIDRVVSKLRETDAVVPGIKSVSTLKYVESGKMQTLDRDKVYIIQTPQGFKTDVLKKSYELYCGDEATDSSTIVSAAGFNVAIVAGDKKNIKITIPEDYNDIKV